MYYSYILKLVNNTYYAGFSSDLTSRYKDHQQGKVSITRNFRPLTLVFYAAFTSEKKALSFEKYLKSSSGSAFRNKHFVEKVLDKNLSK